jgi:hypothetical protein
MWSYCAGARYGIGLFTDMQLHAALAKHHSFILYKNKEKVK